MLAYDNERNILAVKMQQPTYQQYKISENFRSPVMRLLAEAALCTLMPNYNPPTSFILFSYVYWTLQHCDS